VCCQRCTLIVVSSERWFLKLDGIPGDSTYSTHKGEIDIDAWSWGGSSAGSLAFGGGGGAGKVTLQDFHFVTQISSASPKVFLACATGSHLKDALLSGVRNVGKGKGNDLVKYKLGDVSVTNFQHGDDREGTPRDSFSLSFSKVEVSYFPQNATGKIAPPTSAGYDIKMNKKI
jgi:type VI secretion system secreted protein Hcp